MQSDDKSIISNHFNKLSILEEKFVIKSFLANARYINMSNIKKLKDITRIENGSGLFYPTVENNLI
jgi:hypothetical protein